ncbi:MAG TPA: glycosyltransferase family 4 protein [Candidatus Sumerlaeota bacterium]|nr:glycosyltransferase family 4 protein [Candidatus Sumerlaeota bacterium]
MPDSATDPSPILLYLRPSDPTRTAISEYAGHFLEALRNLSGVEVVDFLSPEVTERIDTREDRNAVLLAVEERIQPYLREERRIIVHADAGNALHREFWATIRLQELLLKARFFCTVHDPPQLCSNPYRYVHTEYAGLTRLRLFNVALTKAAETAVAWGKHQIERRFVRRCEALLALTEAGCGVLRTHPLYRGARIERLNHVFAESVPESRDYTSFQPISDPVLASVRPDEILITFFSFIAPNKGIEDLLEGFEQLTNRLSEAGRAIPVRLLIFGGVSPRACPPGYLDTLERRVAGSRHARQIHFAPGFAETTLRDARLERTDILVLPFRTAPGVAFSSASAIRALALGKAIVAAAANTIEEEIVHNQTGLMYPEGDTNALAERLLELCVNPPLRLRLATTAQRHAREDHFPEAVARQLERLYFPQGH